MYQYPFPRDPRITEEEFPTYKPPESFRQWNEPIATTREEARKKILSWERVEDKFKDIDLNSEYLLDITKRPISKVSETEMFEYGVHTMSRDLCAHIYIALTECKRQTLWAPWRCQRLKNAYNICQLHDSIRCKKQTALKYRRFYEQEFGEEAPAPRTLVQVWDEYKQTLGEDLKPHGHAHGHAH